MKASAKPRPHSHAAARRPKCECLSLQIRIALCREHGLHNDIGGNTHSSIHIALSQRASATVSKPRAVSRGRSDRASPEPRCPRENPWVHCCRNPRAEFVVSAPSSPLISGNRPKSARPEFSMTYSGGLGRSGLFAITLPLLPCRFCFVLARKSR